MPCTSAVRATGSTSSTPSRPETSSPGAVVAARGRKRFEVRFARRTGAPGGSAAYDDARAATAARCRSPGLRDAVMPVTSRTLRQPGSEGSDLRPPGVTDEQGDAAATEVGHGAAVGGAGLLGVREEHH